jgi:hypothetical protein
LGVKKPGWPSTSAPRAAASFAHCRGRSPSGAGQGIRSGVIVSQKSRSLVRRSAGALPAMIAALMAPMETPQSQSGAMPASSIAWKTPPW